MKTAVISKKQRRILYPFFLVSLLAMYATYVPYLMDYYIIRPEESFFAFLDLNILNATYRFEGIVMAITIVIFYCMTLHAGISALVPSLLFFILTHASYTKYINRRELLRLDDLRLTEAAGMAANYIRFELNGYLFLLFGGLALFAVAGFVIEWFGRVRPRRKTDRKKRRTEEGNGREGRLEKADQSRMPERGEPVEEEVPVQALNREETEKEEVPGQALNRKETRREKEQREYSGEEEGLIKESTESPDSSMKIVRLSFRAKRRLALGARLLCAALLCLVMVLYVNHFLRSRYVIDVIGPLIPENNMYVLYRFLQNDSLSSITMENVEESYDFLLSQEKAKETEEDSVYPNVIVIMNESWWNTDNIDPDRISFSQDPMSAFRELADCCSTGFLTSNVFGGGTVSPEMEFLTGINTKYYLADSAYAQTLGHKLPSLADYFNGLDYETVAIHPYYGHFYKRDSVYRTMEFDKVIFEEDMEYRELYSRYISDESLVKQIISEMEEQSGKPKFIWSVSMANHLRVLDFGPEPTEEYDYPITVDLKGKQLGQEDYDTLVNYVNGIYFANQAFAQLVEYFSETEEPTVIMMFGDHSPYFSEETLELFGIHEEDGDIDTLARMYSTPVIFWSNLSKEKPEFSGESMYYLPQVLIDYAGLPDSAMTRILRYERKYFKTNSKKIVRDAAGEELWGCTMEEIRALSHYKAVQYDILWGDGICGDVWKPIL